MAAQIFISHARKDARVAQTICDALEQRGSACWIAARDVDAGENFQVAIVRAIRAAKVFILIFSANANNSDEIKKEVVLAGRHRLVVIPVRIEDAAPDEGLDYELATRQWIDYFEDRDAALQRLVRRLEAVSGTEKIEAEASPVSIPAPAEAVQCAPSVVQVSDIFEEKAVGIRYRPGAPNWPVPPPIPWRGLLIGIIGAAVLTGIVIGSNPIATRQSMSVSDQSPASGATWRPSDAPSTTAPVLKLSPALGAARSASDQPANAANASAISTLVPSKGSMSVREAKRILSRLGFYSGDVDDLNDSRLGEALTAFQKNYGLPESGVIGPKTTLKSRQLYSERQNQ